MSNEVKILATRPVDDAQTVSVRSATFRGSSPFGGEFEVWDVDTCQYTDAATSKLMLMVRCQWGDDQDTDEDATLELELCEPVTHCCEGFIGDVVARIGFAWPLRSARE